MPERVKKHCIKVNARKENVRDNVAVRQAFFCAFSEFPASSPSSPKKKARTREFFLFFNWISPVFLMASRGVRRLNFLAGYQADIHTVNMVIAKVNTNTNG